MVRWTLATAGLAMLVTLPAAGQERPIMRPTRDVAVVYHVQAAGPSGEPETRTVQMYWTGQGTRLRLQTDGQPGFGLVDYAAGRMTMVMLPQKAYAVVTFDADHAPGLNIPPGAVINRSGSDTVAGVACTEWTLQGPQGGGTACITKDGLMLRVRGAQPGEPAAMVAVSVAYGPQPAGLFTLPAGLHEVAPPQ
jgi:Domain of unknown function (DUF4412)